MRSSRRAVAAVADHRPDLAVAPRRVGRRARPDRPTNPHARGGARSARARRSAHRTSRSACPRPHGRARGPRRAQVALGGLLHTRRPTAASPRAWVRAATSASAGPAAWRARTGRPSARCGRPQERPLPDAHGLLGDLRSTGGLSDADLTLQVRQHDPDLLLDREHRRPRHVDQTLSAGHRPQPTGPATKPDAGQSPRHRGEGAQTLTE